MTGERTGAPGGLRLLRPYLLRHWRALAAASGATLVLVASELAQPWPLKVVIDHLLLQRGSRFSLDSGDFALLALAGTLVVAVAAAGAAASYWSELLLNRAGERIVHELRVATYAHLQRLSLSFHQGQQKGDLVTRVTGDVNAVGVLFSESLGSIAAAALLLAGMATVSLVLDPVLALAVFAVTPLLGWVTFRYRRRIKELARRQRAEEGAIASLATEALSAMQVVKAFGSEGYERGRVELRSELRRTLGVEAARAEARFAALVDLLGALTAMLVLVLGVFRVASGALTPGSLIVFAAYAARTYKPLREIARQTAKISRAAARGDRIAALLGADQALEERPHALAGPRARGDIALHSVSFRYDEARPALDEVTLSIPTGTRVAVVGPSGAGKSTLGALVARFYDPQAGTVRIDGRDVRDCSLAWLREQVGFLLQDTVLFRGSVRDNIAYGTEATHEQVVAAARAADADAFVRGLPEGYDTQLGPSGAGLSGGQRQRLGIARVLLRNPPILVLDEPTAALDAGSESRLLGALDVLMRERTTILITHSLALARRAGRAIVLEGGRVVEDGSPSELLARGGLFRRLAVQQGVVRASAAQSHSLSRDRALPQLAALLEPESAAVALSSTLRPGSALDAIRVRALRYKPGRRLVVRYDALVDGEPHEAVAIADVKANLSRVAKSRRGRALARRARDRSPVDEPLVYDGRLDVLLQWLPLDLGLPALAIPAQELARRVHADEVHPAGGPRVKRLSYKPLGRAVLRLDGRVVKAYARQAEYARAARGLREVSAAGIVPTPSYVGELRDLRATVQTALSGRVASDELRLAPAAGALLRELHGLELDHLPVATAERQLAAAAAAGGLVATITPALASRVGALLRRLGATVPPPSRLVCSHGDFEVGQLLERPEGVAVLDLDDLRTAPAALDLATFAAHAVRGEGASAGDVLETITDAYGSCPSGLRWYLATAILLRAPAPFCKLEERWPEHVCSIVVAAEKAAP